MTTESDDAVCTDYVKPNVQQNIANSSNFSNHYDKNKARKLLPDGFGFTEKTYQFRLPEYQPTRNFQAVIYERRCNNGLSNSPKVGEIRLAGQNEYGKGHTKQPNEMKSIDQDDYGVENTNQQSVSRADDRLPKLNNTTVSDGNFVNNHTTNSSTKDNGGTQHQAPNTKCLTGRKLNEEDLEEDTITVLGVVRKTLPSGSKFAPDEFIYSSVPSKKQKPVAKTSILIPHICGRKLQEDEFGAKLYTYKIKQRDEIIYYKHYLVKVKADGPAEQMGIEEGDEIVLLLGEFVPDDKHEDALKVFHKIKVDGKTRFFMVIRRERDQRWVWKELSAILAPEMGEEDYPIVEKARIITLKDNCHQYSDTQEFYKVPGTQLYLQIRNGIVSVDIMNEQRDKTKIIWKRFFVCQADDTGEFKFEASLSDETKKLYINIDQNKNVVLNSEPQLFQIFGVKADKIRFRANETYLGYDRQTKVVRAQLINCEFEEFPVTDDSNLDQPDGHCTNEKEGDTANGIVSQSYSNSSHRSTESRKRNILPFQMD